MSAKIKLLGALLFEKKLVGCPSWTPGPVVDGFVCDCILRNSAHSGHFSPQWHTVEISAGKCKWWPMRQMLLPLSVKPSSGWKDCTKQIGFQRLCKANRVQKIAQNKYGSKDCTQQIQKQGQCIVFCIYYLPFKLPKGVLCI